MSTISLANCQRFTGGRWLVEPADVEKRVSIESDSRKDCSKALFIAFEGERFDAHDFVEAVIDKGASAVCVHKKSESLLLEKAKTAGIAILLVEDTIKAYQDLATGKLSESDCTVIGITGSSGKTSVKAILSQMLESAAQGQVLSTIANTNNHIGVPQNVLRLEDHHKYAVIEMGTNNPGEIAVLAQCAPPDFAVITSIGDSHSGNFPENGILYEKSDIIKHMKEDALAIIPEELKGKIQSTGVLEGRDFLTFGIAGTGVYADYVCGTLDGAELVIEGKEVKTSLSGRHQAQNISACMTVMKQLGFELDDYLGSLGRLELPGMRMKIQEEQGVTWVNDAYNANPQSMLAFIEWLRDIPGIVKNYKNRFLVLGDMLELGDNSLSFHEEVVESIPGNWKIIGVGENFCSAAKGEFPTFIDSESASEFICRKIQAGDLVALKASRGIKLEEIYKKFTN
ncbi:MAG: UDP-N-acetylmuramoyl-tripeptide--D-alanyl-D-alanine ligase [Lentisphaerales bacterium]|nr:UDP-N-acetylmuramoyl-tripeptide--D-alanyl-D-alanine ligase [Lentisphaerales bacterium]